MKKTMFILTLIITTQLYAQSKVDSLEKCLSATDSIDREYCHKKRAKAIEQGFFENYKKWEAGYSQADKDKAKQDQDKAKGDEQKDKVKKLFKKIF